MALCIIVCRALGPFLLNWPTWASPFVKEFSPQGAMVSPAPKKRLLGGATMLLVIFLVGLVLQLVTVFYPHLDLNTTAVAPAISWVIDLPQSKNCFDRKIRPYSSFSLRLIDRKPHLLQCLLSCSTFWQHS